MLEPVLEIRDVVKYYGDTAVLNGVSFKVFRGETKIIIGASGSGKSTILKLIMASATYRQSSAMTDPQEFARAMKVDPANQLLWRQRLRRHRGDGQLRRGPIRHLRRRRAATVAGARHGIG